MCIKSNSVKVYVVKQSHCGVVVTYIVCVVHMPTCILVDVPVNLISVVAQCLYPVLSSLAGVHNHVRS